MTCTWLGLHDVQDALVVGDDQHAHVGSPATVLTPLATMLQRVDVEAGVGLVEHGELGLLERELEDLHALLLAAGEALVEVARARTPSGPSVSSIAASTVLRNSFSEIGSLAARLAVRVHDHAQVLRDRHARDRRPGTGRP